MYLLGYDVGSSSVKASIVDAGTGKCVATSYYPKIEAPILSEQPGWAEQEPEMWWQNLKHVTRDVLAQASGQKPGSVGSSGSSPDTSSVARAIAAIGISYQMHGCDSRAVPYGEKAFRHLGEERCLSHLLNSPGNFTAAKLAWVKENEPRLYERIHKIMLPGDYIALKLSGTACTTVSGLSEGMFWDFKEGRVADFLLDEFGFSRDILADIVPTFAEQGRVCRAAAEELGLAEGTPITYRAGDQPNNALSLNVFEPGEVASTAGTSGVVYGVSGKVNYDPQSRVNTFAHVNHTPQQDRLGILLCINGTGILNSWMRRNVCPEDFHYTQMNQIASMVPIGCDGVSILPFGNGAERVLGNRETGCHVFGLNFNIHNRSHLIRATQEGIVFSFKYGMDIMAGMGMDIRKIHAGKANMFLSPMFREALAGTTGATIELFNTDGSVGAAKGAGIGAGIYKDHNEAFATLERLEVIEPDHQEEYAAAYAVWKEELEKQLKTQ